MRRTSKPRAGEMPALALALALTSAVTLLSSCTATPPLPSVAPGPSEADLSFATVSDRYFQEMLPLTPVTATALGEHRYDATLDDVSAAGEAKRTELARDLLTQLDALDRARLSRAHQVDARLLTNELQYVLWQS